MDFLTGMKVVEERHSAVNGKIQVIKSLGFGTYIQVEGLTQSGGVVYDVWNTVLRKVSGKKEDVKRVIILGLGGGSAARLINKYWPDASITGVDIDPVIVELGRKYLRLDQIPLKTKLGDAMEVVKNMVKSGEKYDLILIDMYVGYEVPEKFTTGEFIKSVKSLLGDQGIAVFNRLYFGQKRPLAVKFGDKLETVFFRVDAIYPEANVMFVCS